MSSPPLVTKVEEVIEVINLMVGHRMKKSAVAYPDLEKILTGLTEMPFISTLVQEMKPDLFLVIGNKAIREMGVSVADNGRVIAFAEMLLSKHKLYGAGPITRWGCIGVIMRIDSKYQRVLNMRKPVAHENMDMLTGKQESLSDTLWDILGYAILGYIFAHGEK